MSGGRAKGTGTIFKPKGSRFYWVAYVSGGKRRFEGTKSERRKDAQELLTSRLGDTQRGLVVTPALGKIILNAGLKAVVDDLKINDRQSARCPTCRAVCNQDGHTNDTQRRIDLHILKFFAPDRRMNTISTADIEAYKAHRSIDQKAKAATINRELAIIRRAFRLALRGDALAAMPYVGLLQEHNVRQGFFERGEFDQVLTHLPPDYHPPLEFMFTTGWRKSEVLNLTVANVDLVARTVQLPVGTTKSGEGRTFILTDALYGLLKKQVHSTIALKKQDVICPWVFHRLDGSQIKSVRSAWDAATEAAGYPHKILHDFRRTAVRNLERAGVPRSTAMRMVGHQTESIYRRYAIQDEAMLREASVKLEAWTDAQAAAKRTAGKGELRPFKKRRSGGRVKE